MAADGAPSSNGWRYCRSRGSYRRFRCARGSLRHPRRSSEGRYRRIFPSRTFHPSRYSAGRRSLIPGLGRAIRLVMPRSHSGSRSSSSYVIGSGNSRESLRSFQNRFEYPAKWWPVIADRTPGLMPTNSTRKPGRMRSFKRSLDQSDFIILFLAVTSTFNAKRSAFQGSTINWPVQGRTAALTTTSSEESVSSVSS